MKLNLHPLEEEIEEKEEVSPENIEVINEKKVDEE